MLYWFTGASCRNPFECKRGGVRYVGPTKLVQNTADGDIYVALDRNKATIPSQKSFSLLPMEKKQGYVIIFQCPKYLKHFPQWGCLHFWGASIREESKEDNLMEAAKKISNDLMPFAFKKFGNDLMSFCSKEWVDRLGWIDSAQDAEKSVSREMQLDILLLSRENNCIVELMSNKTSPGPHEDEIMTGHQYICNWHYEGLHNSPSKQKSHKI